MELRKTGEELVSDVIAGLTKGVSEVLRPAARLLLDRLGRANHLFDALFVGVDGVEVAPGVAFEVGVVVVPAMVLHRDQ